MELKKKAPTDGTAIPDSGLTSAQCDHSVSETLASNNFTIFTWRFLSPADLNDEDSIRRACLGALAGIHNAFADGGTVVSLHNDIEQLAAEIRRLVEVVR